MKLNAMQSVIAGVGLSLLYASALASPCYPAPQETYPDPSQNAGYPPPAQPAQYDQSAQQPCAPEVPVTQPSGNVVTRAVDAAKQQADSEVQFEARRRVRDIFDRVFSRY